jgi:AAA domain
MMAAFPVPAQEPHPSAENLITATPFRWRDPALIPPRAWIYPHQYIRSFTSSTVAAGGTGKSSLVIAEAIAIATGRDLLGVRPRETVPVWYWNGEDPPDEIERRIAALCQYYDIGRNELEGRFFIDTGGLLPIKIAYMNGAKVTVATKVTDEICAAIETNKIGVLVIDPFISCHSISENDNGAIDAVAKAWGRIANRTNSSVELVHHIRKLAKGQTELIADDARGGSSLVNAVRVVRVLNRMSLVEARKASVGDRKRFFRVDTGKANLAPPEATTWFAFMPTALPNGDSVAVVTPWKFRDVSDDVTTAHTHRFRDIVRDGGYRKDSRSPEWVGNAVAEVMGLDPDNDRWKIRDILRVWFANGVLAVERRQDEKSRKQKTFVIPGNWHEPQQPESSSHNCIDGCGA